MTLVQINNQIKSIASQNAMIETIFFGNLPDRMALGDIRYPVFCFDLLDSVLEVQKETLNYQFWFLDKMNPDKSNEEDALSDMISISNDMVAALSLNSNEFQINRTINKTRIQDESPDQVCGVMFNLQIYQPYENNRCQIPS